MRGEHSLDARALLAVQGSSPHARGALQRGRIAAPPERDHPRMRGEHKALMREAFGVEGSSPHARGAPAS